MPGQDGDSLIARSRAAAERCGLEFQVGHTDKPLYVDPQSPFVTSVLAMAGKSAAHTVPYGTDGVAFGELENLLVLGPGDIAQAHTHNEWISLDQLESGTALFTRLIEHYCC
jgi:acetylornithine deacetylase